MAPRIIAARLEKSEKLKIFIWFFAVTMEVNCLFYLSVSEVCLCVKVCVLMYNITHWVIIFLAASLTCLQIDFTWLAVTHTGTRLQRLILGLDSHNLQRNGDDNWSIDIKLTISFHYKRSQSLSQLNSRTGVEVTSRLHHLEKNLMTHEVLKHYFAKTNLYFKTWPWAAGSVM